MQNMILTIPQAAAICSLSRGTLWKYVKSGDLRASMTPGGQYRIQETDLEDFMRRKGMHPFARYVPEKNRILIVDDDFQVQRLIAKMLSRNGWETDVASDGFDAGVKIMAFKPGLVILDLFMPGMDGFEVCRRIKEDPASSHIKVFTITGYDSPQSRDRIMALGSDAYMTKPIHLETMLQRIAALVGG